MFTRGCVYMLFVMMEYSGYYHVIGWEDGARQHARLASKQISNDKEFSPGKERRQKYYVCRVCRTERGKSFFPHRNI